jgi:hypothetical protein
VNCRVRAVAFIRNWGKLAAGNEPMPKLLVTNSKGKQRSFDLVSASNSQRPNEIQTHELDQVNRRLPPNILEELAARGLTIPPSEIGLLLSRLKAPDLKISIGD